MTMFFTFWGLNAIRKPEKISGLGKNLVESAFGMMMPRGRSLDFCFGLWPAVRKAFRNVWLVLACALTANSSARASVVMACVGDHLKIAVKTLFMRTS